MILRIGLLDAPDGTLISADKYQFATLISFGISNIGNLDTRNKRGSAIGIDFDWVHIYPNPDGTIDVFDRQQSAYKYSGISTAVGTSVVRPYRTLLGVGG